MKKKILFIFGTRPEAIKLIPLVVAVRRHALLQGQICVTSQHRALLDEVLDIFSIKPHYDLDLMRDNQQLDQLHSRAIASLQGVLAKSSPHLVVVQGDTTSAFCGAISAFYNKIPVAHVEAGLRSFDKYKPFPEEVNRRLISVLSDYHFCPTNQSRKNLLKEGVSAQRVWVVGNTVLDALRLTVAKKRTSFVGPKLKSLSRKRKIVLVTLHRRETWGENLAAICRQLRALAGEFSDHDFVFPAHPNPKVKHVVQAALKGQKNCYVTPPLGYKDFTLLMQSSHLILTDSGGVQEEAPSLGKPVLVLRDTTERPEIVDVGAAKLVGTNPKKIHSETRRLLRSRRAYASMCGKKNPYGDGFTAEKIVRVFSKILKKGMPE